MGTRLSRKDCQGFKLKLGNHEFTLDLLLFDLEDFNLILGVSWLTLLGEMVVD